jgi:hypothetical protein
MIELDSSDWHVLRHAHGPAIDVPLLLCQLSANPRPQNDHRGEPWISLWSSLCHQGDVYSASYAAVPHVVQIGWTAAGEIDSGLFLLPTCIAVERAIGRGAILDDQAASSYARGKLHGCAFAHGAYK